MTDEDLWRRVCAAQAEVRRTRIAFIHESTDRAAVLASALDSEAGRLDALEYLRMVDGEETRRAVFASLVRIVAGAAKYFEWAQQLVLGIDRAWVTERIDAIAEPALLDWEGHSALAWLYGQLGDDALIARHSTRCAAHADPDIRELADD